MIVVVEPVADDELRLVRGGSAWGWIKKGSQVGQGSRGHWSQAHRHRRQVLRLRSAPAELAIVRQRKGNDCGRAALATVAACHGYAVDMDVWDEIPLDRHGVDLLALSRSAERLGFRSRGIKASYDAIETCPLPAIAHVRRRFGGGHFGGCRGGRSAAARPDTF